MSTDNGRAASKERFDWLKTVIGLDIEPSAKAVATALWLHADGKGVAFPSVAKLVKASHTSPMTVRRALVVLDGLGLVGRSRPDAAMRKRMAAANITRADRLPNVYALSLNGVPQTIPREGGNGVPRTVGRKASTGYHGGGERGTTATVPKQSILKQPIKSKSCALTAASPPSTPKTDHQKAMFKAVADAFGFPLDALDDDDRKRLGKTAKRLIAKKAAPEEVAVRKRHYAELFGEGIACTLEAVAKHWHNLAEGKVAKGTEVVGRVRDNLERFDHLKVVRCG